jgi:Carboxypeptidase regulatory-like domain
MKSRVCCCKLAFLVVLATAISGWGQTGSQGTVTLTVLDQTGGVVPATDLTLQDLSTNDVRQGTTTGGGTYSFIGLNIGKYKLTVSKVGFASEVHEAVTVQASRVTDIIVTLKVGAITQSVVVTAGDAPLVEATSSAIGTTIDMKQIEELPINGRDVSQLAFLVPGWTMGADGNGTFNGLPGGAIVGANIDGVQAVPGRFRSAGYGWSGLTAVGVQVENIQEMTIQTDQVDLGQGFGTDVQINFVTRRGSNKFHGRAFGNFQNAGLNANSWLNDANGLRKEKFIRNSFGFSLGGPIFRDKLFFFADYSELKEPGSRTNSTPVLMPAAQAGNVTYTDTTGATQTVNVLQIAQANGLPYLTDIVVAGQQAAINTSLTTPGAKLTLPVVGADPNLETINFQNSAPLTEYHPAFRLDYDASASKRFFGAWNFTKAARIGAYPQAFPGQAFAWQTTGNSGKAYTAALGFDWTVKPNLINQFRGGFLYNTSSFSPEAKSLPSKYLQLDNTIWAFGTSGSYPVLAQTSYYPLMNASDTVTWMHGAHSFSFGGQWYREQDHYWNVPLGWEYKVLFLAGGDPALNVFQKSSPSLPNITDAGLSDVQNIYATLTGDLGVTFGQHPYDPKTKQYKPYGAYNLDELMQSYGLFFQDSFRVKPGLTLNYGLRWDFVGDNHDLGNVYHGASVASLFAPSGIGNEFKPGTLSGPTDPLFVASGHQYNPFHRLPQPSIGLAWSPGRSDGFLGKLIGGAGKSVLRGGYSLRNYLEGQQNFWNYASNYGSFFYQSAERDATQSSGVGFYAPGTLHLQDFPCSGPNPPANCPASGVPTPVDPRLAPVTYQNSVPMSELVFSGQGLAGMNPHIKAPYVQSWNVGIQRALGANSAIEIRYVGNRGSHEWIGYNINEVNIFENGFLDQFKIAQSNQNINTAHGYDGKPGDPAPTFADNGFPGQLATPIFDAAFAGEGPGQGYGDAQFINWLQKGAAGSLAQMLAGGGGPFYLCNMVGTNFAPCAGFGSTSAGPYPANFFQLNPYEAGGQVQFLDAIGYSTYNSLQVEFRQKQWRGMQFNANYAFGKTLGTAPQNNIGSQANFYTLRNQRLNYQPSTYDIRQVVNVSGTYDLPFGPGKYFLNGNRVLNRVAGGWTVGTIFKYQTGSPFQLSGGWLTFNDTSDGGVKLTNITAAQLQKAVGVFRPVSTGAATPFVYTFNPKLIASDNLSANKAYLNPNTTPGTFGPRFWLYGPHWINVDLALTKRTTIREGLTFVFQGEFLNAFNHVNFGNPNSNVQGFGFGEAGPANGPRQIELRANFEF